MRDPMKGLIHDGVFLALICAALAIAALGQSHSFEKESTSLPPDVGPQYFPTGILDADIDPNFRFPRQRWYAKHLRAMSEPSLFASANDKTMQAYRFLWLRTFNRPVAVRVVIGADGTGTVNTKVLDGAGGYSPGKVIVDRSNEVKKEQVQAFFKLLADTNFWTIETEQHSSGKDGAQWIVEGLQDGRYHVVDR
jgi:hypothetical protein